MKKLLLLTLIFGLSAHLFAETPKWFENSKKSGVSEKTYFIGYGEGFSYDEAIANATTEIAGQLETSIKNTTTIQHREIEDSATFVSTREAESSISSLVQQTLHGVEIPKRAADNDRYYALATLNKKKFEKKLKKDIDVKYKEAKTMLESAKKFEKDKKIIESLEHYITLFNHLQLTEDIIQIHNGFAKKQYKSPKKLLSGSIKSHIQETLNHIQIQTLGSKTQKANLGESLTPISFKVTYKKSPLSDISVLTSYSDGKKIATTITNTSGTTSVTPIAVPFSKNNHYIEAKIHLNTIPSSWLKSLQHNSTRSYYTIAKNNITTITLVPKSTTDQKAIDHLKNEIESLGITITNDAEHIIEAEFSITDQKELNSPYGPKFIAYSQWILTLKDSSGKTLGNNIAKGRGMNATTEQAIEKAKTKVKLNKQTFLELLSKGLNKEQ